MCFKVKPNVDLIPKLSGIEERVDGNAMRARIEALPIEWKKVKGTDFWYYIPTFDDWVLIINYLKKRVPKYLTDKFDCENFGGWWRVKVAEIFGINTMADVEGFAPRRRHGWSFFPDNEGFWYQMESQTGVIMDIDNTEYIPDEIVYG